MTAGPVSPAQTSGTAATGAASTTVAPEVNIGGANAVITYRGLAPDFVGLYQINAVVPSGIASGNQPVIIIGNGINTNSALLPVK